MSEKKSNVINVKARMLEEAHYGKTYFRVSDKAIQEEISYLNALIEVHMSNICKRLLLDGSRKKRKTVLEEDIIRENGRLIQSNKEGET
jgi:histone H3/H4